MTAAMRIPVMLAVPSAPDTADWYRRALGATQPRSLGSVIGLEMEGVPFFLHEPTGSRFGSPVALGATTVRVEVFCDDPDAFVARAVAAGADGSADPIRDHQTPWGCTGRAGSPIPSGTSGSWATPRR